MKLYQNVSLSTIGWLSVLLICYVIARPNIAKANTSLSVSPLIQTLSLSNASQSANLSISNNGDNSVNFSLEILPFKQSIGISARPILGSRKEISTSSYLNDITVTINNQPFSFFSLPPHSSQILRVNIPPQSKSFHAQDYYFCLLFSTNNTSPLSETPTKTSIDAYLSQNLSIGSLFLVSPSMKSLKYLQDPSIQSIEQKLVNYNNNLQGKFVLKNINNTYQNISINIIRKNILGNVIQNAQLPQAFILAKGTRTFSYFLDTQNDLGPENLIINVRDLHSGKSLTYTRFIFLLPIKSLLYVVILIMFAIFVSYKIKARLRSLN